MLILTAPLFADGQMRVEFSSYVKLEYDASPGISVGGSIRGNAEQPTHVLRLTSATALIDQWLPINITLHASEDALLTMKLRAGSAAEMLVDHLSLSGSKLLNGADQKFGFKSTNSSNNRTKCTR